MKFDWGHATGMTAVFLLVGGAVGSLLGTLVLLVLSIGRVADWSLELIAGVWVIGTMVGTPLGMIGAPVLGWLFLRRVPLGRAITHTAVGTVIGSLAGFALWHLARIGGDVGGVFLVVGAVAGFVVSAVLLWGTHRRIASDSAA